MFENNYSTDGIKYFRLSEQSNKDTHLPGGGTVRVVEGNDVTVVALGTRLDASVSAANDLRTRYGCDVLLVNRVKPLDDGPIRESVRRTGRLVVVEEHSVTGGLADACLQALAGLPFQFRALGVRDFIHMYGTHEELCVAAGVASKDIYNAISSMMESGGVETGTSDEQ